MPGSSTGPLVCGSEWRSVSGTSFRDPEVTAVDAERRDALEDELARLNELVEMFVETQAAALQELMRIRDRPRPSRRGRLVTGPRVRTSC